MVEKYFIKNKKNMNKPKFTAIIPARYASSRFPGKPLAKIGGVEMIVRVARQVEKSVDSVIVATDDERISQCVESNGIKCVMTSPAHRSGTDRIAEACRLLDSDSDVVINVQGDEPFIRPEQIEQLKECFISREDTQIATLVRLFDKNKGFEALFDPNIVKVVFSGKMKALYFSRSIIPYVRGVEWQDWLSKSSFHTHIGIYAYRREVLDRITHLPPSPLELAESLEQLRWLQAGIPIDVAVSDYPTVGIDTPADLEAAERMLREMNDI